MDRKKLLKLISVFFVLFILSGIGSIINYYYGIYPQMFTRAFSLYDVLRLNNATVVKLPAVPLILLILTISVFVYLVRKLYKHIVNEIKNEKQGVK